MTKMTKTHMMNRPYIRAVIDELQGLGYEGDKAKEVLLKHYRVLRRTWGFEPNAVDFAREIVEIEKAVNKKYDPGDPNQIYIGDLRNRLKANKKHPVRVRVISTSNPKNVHMIRHGKATVR